MDGMVMQEEAVKGLAVSDEGFKLALGRRTAAPTEQFVFAFRILDARGRTVRDFDVAHTKRLHLIVVRRDMTGFQHLHPSQLDDGSWAMPLAVRDAGAYRVFADFSTGGRAYVLADDLLADGTVAWQPLPAPAHAVEIDGFQIQLNEGSAPVGDASPLEFNVTRDGLHVQLQNYLGAKGHLVALRQGDLAYLHVHPDPESLGFMAAFPSSGSYRLFLQFKVGGRVHTAAFTQEVAPSP